MNFFVLSSFIAGKTLDKIAKFSYVKTRQNTHLLIAFFLHKISKFGAVISRAVFDSHWDTEILKYDKFVQIFVLTQWNISLYIKKWRIFKVSSPSVRKTVVANFFDVTIWLWKNALPWKDHGVTSHFFQSYSSETKHSYWTLNSKVICYHTTQCERASVPMYSTCFIQFL